MFCKFCGRNIIDESEFCPYCGKRAEKSRDFGSAAPFPYKNSAVKPNPQKKLVILISLSCAAVALAAILVAVILLCARSPKGSGAVVLPSISGSTATQTATAPTTTTTTTAPTTTTTKAATTAKPTTAKPTTAKPTAAYDMAWVREIVDAYNKCVNYLTVCSFGGNSNLAKEAYRSYVATGGQSSVTMSEITCCDNISEAEKHFHKYFVSSIDMPSDGIYAYNEHLFACVPSWGGVVQEIQSVELCKDGKLKVKTYESSVGSDKEKKTLVLQKENGVYKYADAYYGW